MDELELFKLFLVEEKGQKENTLKTNIKLMSKILKDCHPLSMDSAKGFIRALIDRRASPSYIKQYVSVLRQWGQCFKLHDLAEYKYPKLNYESEFVRATFEDEEIHRFLNFPNPYKKSHKRKDVFKNRYDMWIMFYSILFYHGLRTIEIAKLQTDYIDFGRGIIIIPKHISKTKQERFVPISPAVKEKLQTYVYKIQGKYLFPSFHERTKEKGIMHVGGEDWRRFFNLQLKRIGLERKDLTPYSGRHTYGSRQSDQDISVFKIKEIMGHRRVETTMKYVHTGIKSLQRVQENDRLVRDYLPKKKQLQQIYQKIREIDDQYTGITTIITPNDNDSEIYVKFKIKQG